MVNILFDSKNGSVIKISNSDLFEYEGYLICTSEDFKEGDEYLTNITVQSVEEGLLKSYQQTINNFQYIPVIRMYQEQLIKTLEIERKIKLLDDQQERLDIIDSAIVAIGAEVWKEV